MADQVKTPTDSKKERILQSRVIVYGLLLSVMSMVIFLWINIFSYNVLIAGGSYYYRQGWPWVISQGFCFEDYDIHDFPNCRVRWTYLPYNYYCSTSIFANLGFYVVFVFSCFFTVDYFHSLRKYRPRFFLSELFILVTATAVIFSFLQYEQRKCLLPYTDRILIYQPLHDLSLGIQILLWFGIGCMAWMIGCGIVHGLGMLFRKRKTR
jgi:hypothetical protein